MAARPSPTTTLTSSSIRQISNSQPSNNKRKEPPSQLEPRARSRAKTRATSARPSTSTTTTLFDEGSEREAWLIERLKDKSIFLPLLVGKDDSRGSRSASKATIHRRLAQEFNDKMFPLPAASGFFSTNKSGTGIKTKLVRMQSAFKAARTMHMSSGFESTNKIASWRRQIQDLCPFYWSLEPVWGQQYWKNDIKILADSRTNLSEDRVAADDDHREAADGPYEEDEAENQDECDRQTLQVLRSTSGLARLDGRRASFSAPQASRSTPRPRTQMAWKKTASKKRELVKEELNDLNQMTLITAQLEYQKALMRKEVALKTIELKMKRQEQAFRLKMARIKARRTRKSTRSEKSGNSADDTSDSSISSVDVHDYITI
ncbi:hypothetical protein DFQ26_004309 [Actinomortierella ambigua]|nr:hypothetical protein DFQ26_004309 [Actinomortierella ambigua]